jgi:hypothetical protein
MMFVFQRVKIRNKHEISDGLKFVIIALKTKLFAFYGLGVTIARFVFNEKKAQNIWQFKISTYLCTRNNIVAQMAELVDALVSNTSRFTPVPVRSRLWVQNKSFPKQREAFVVFACYRVSFVYNLFFKGHMEHPRT